MSEFLKPTLTAFFAQIGDEFRALPQFQGSVLTGAWSNQTGITVGYMSWLPSDDPSSETLDLTLDLLPLSSKTADVSLDLAWSSGELITELFHESLSFDSSASLIAQIEALLVSQRANIIRVLRRTLEGQL
jgi:hypothetical protein